MSYLTTEDLKLNEIDADDPEVCNKLFISTTSHHLNLAITHHNSKLLPPPLAPPPTPLSLQVSDYSMLPNIQLLANQVKSCLQESCDEIPQDVNVLFDSSLFKLDTGLVTPAIKLVSLFINIYLII